MLRSYLRVGRLRTSNHQAHLEPNPGRWKGCYSFRRQHLRCFFSAGVFSSHLGSLWRYDNAADPLENGMTIFGPQSTMTTHPILNFASAKVHIHRHDSLHSSQLEMYNYDQEPFDR